MCNIYTNDIHICVLKNTFTTGNIAESGGMYVFQ